MQIVVGLILVIVSVGMIVVARPKHGHDSVVWLKPWILGRGYVLAALLVAVLGLSFVLTGWPG